MVKASDVCCCVCCCFLWNRIIKILGFFKAPILKIYGCFKTPIMEIYRFVKRLFGDTGDSEQRTHRTRSKEAIEPRTLYQSREAPERRTPSSQLSEVDRTFSEFMGQPDSAAQDTHTYRQGYPGKEDNLNLCDNWLFYSNKKNGRNDMFIDQVQQDWFGNYRVLENRHDYIQWLFPIREKSMFNHRAQDLQLHEAKRIREDPTARQRVLRSYRIMLDFWGMHLEDEKTGVIVRGENWQESFRHLNRSSHNYQRVTRMLKSLGELGFEHLKFPFLSFILSEVFLEKTLINASKSCLHYWIHLLRHEEENRKIMKTALEYQYGG